MQLFASYSRRDSTVVEALIKDLERAHLSVWHDQDLHGGDRWWSDILGRIRDCDVFLFVLSQHSLASKPCQAELAYARALGVPIVPVQVGRVPGLRLSPVADIQVIDYQERTRSEGMALLDAILASAPRKGPLPDPLPEPPPVPFEYLVQLGSAISAQQLSPDEQGSFIRQLAECLDTEDDESVKEDARELLQALLRRPDITVRNAKAAEALLAELAPEELDEPRAGLVWRGLPRREKKPTGRHGPHRRRDSRHAEPPRSPGRSEPGSTHPRGQLSGLVTAAQRQWGRPRVMGSLGVVGILLLGLGFPLGNPVLVRSFNAVFRPPTPVVFKAERAGEPGPDRFTDPASREESAQVPVAAEEGGSSGQSVAGQQPGLYGGTTTNTCDANSIADFLEGQPDRARAWAGAFQPPPSQIRPYLAGLTPVTLRTDTLVTNHGFKNNRAAPFQSLLQAGTAVLVDELGVPRVRCACGNPLAPPKHVDRPNYDTKTPPWKGYSPRTVTTIQPATAAVQKFVIVQPGSGAVVTRPVGTGGEQDAPATPEEARQAQSLAPLPAPEQASGEPRSDAQPSGEQPSGKGSSGGSSEDHKAGKQQPGEQGSSNTRTPIPSSPNSTSPESSSTTSPSKPRSQKPSKDPSPPGGSKTVPSTPPSGGSETVPSTSPSGGSETVPSTSPSGGSETVPSTSPSGGSETVPSTPPSGGSETVPSTPPSGGSSTPTTAPGGSEATPPTPPDTTATTPSSGDSVTPPPPAPPTPGPQPSSEEPASPDPQPSSGDEEQGPPENVPS